MFIPQIDPDGKGYSYHMTIQDFINLVVLFAASKKDAFAPEKYMEVLNNVKQLVADDLEHEEKIEVTFGEFYLKPKDRPAKGQKVDPEKIMVKFNHEPSNLNIDDIFHLSP